MHFFNKFSEKITDALLSAAMPKMLNLGRSSSTVMFELSESGMGIVDTEKYSSRFFSSIRGTWIAKKKRLSD